MNAEQNAALVRRGYEAFGTGDLATLSELLSEDVTFYQPGGSSVSGDHRGRDEVFRYFGQLQERSAGTFRVEIEKLYANDRQVVVVHRATGSRNGSALDTHTALLLDLDGGKVTAFNAIQEDQAAWDAFFRH
jgi:uncharacterized protein